MQAGIILKISLGKYKILSLLGLPSLPNKVSFGQKKKYSVMGGLREHILCFRRFLMLFWHWRISKIIFIIIFIITETWPREPLPHELVQTAPDRWVPKKKKPFGLDLPPPYRDLGSRNNSPGPLGYVPSLCSQVRALARHLCAAYWSLRCSDVLSNTFSPFHSNPLFGGTYSD